ncbi:trehalose operon repressor [Virgibacillus pantothenticus]|uniref:Trehalose operon repressor n=1 Tax=Virgibacillus pantothenticus TaxID=1473 RepID=A0A0L0QL53_VIRPA|nr:trehalose operon repressor [Virgibacillus pantothenticus]KNE18988.1 trehalose operon transcriptional repressor [Virgibacillus pantothenticus]MBU8565291.1 trehalose operon repressor [Virgibacillus pantothenticus]MBU8599490.1 trehalose operon repressor [Virgibacillus pantothenticus]MBU8633610.1 trehalose operon repressor [Virgibacillus pantothenticus]MBU8641770.1 trehalose operon repressor [Virgibacillus pantothenticus]
MQKKYISIYHQLVEQINHEQLPVNTLLPSENELAETYQTSRETIRKALHLLAQHGYIQKIRGKGSVVIDRNRLDFPVSGIVSFKELAKKLNLAATTTVTYMKKVERPNPIYKTMSTKEPIWNVNRVRNIDGENVILDKDYFIETTIPMPSQETCAQSIYDYIEHELDLTISFAQKEITVEEPTEQDRELLDLKHHTNVVVIKSLVYLDDARLFQYTESRHRPDKFKFVDFARRMN